MSRAAHVLIVSSGNPCRNPRPVKEAFALVAAGHRVTLLTPRGDPALDRIDAQLLSAAPFAHETVPTNRGLPARAFGWLARKANPAGLPSIFALGDPRALLRRASSLPADLTIVHNEIPHWIGARLLTTGRRVAADIEDWHSEDLLPADRRHRPLRLLRASEKKLLHHARYVTTTSHALADALFARYGGNRPAVITNAFPLQPSSDLPATRFPQLAAPPSPSDLLATRYPLLATPPPPATLPSDLLATRYPLLATSVPSFFWFSQTLGPGRGLERFLDAWSLTREPSRLVLLGEPRSGYASTLRARLPDTLRAHVTLLPLVPPAALPALIAQHDIGLALEDPAIVNRDLTITNKILQYLNAGLAVVASDTAGQREVRAHAPEAVLIPSATDASAFAAALDDLLRDRPRLLARQLAARQLAEHHYCWEREAPRLLALVENALR